CCGPNSSRVAIRPGISVSAMAISLRPQSARPMSLTTKSAADACVFVFADVVMGILFAGNSHPPRIEAEASFDYALAGTRRDGNKDIKIPLYRSFIAIGHATYRDFVADLKAARAVALSADNSNADQPAFGGGVPGRCAAFTTPACVSAAAICCMRLMRSTAATGGSTKRQAG